MTLFEDDRYAWRETYFVLFEVNMQPRLADVRRGFDIHAGCFSVLDKKVGKNDAMESITIASYEDHAAIEILYSEGAAVLSESEALFETIIKDCPSRERELLRRAKKFAARYSVQHFEQVAGTGVFNVVKRPELRFASPLDRVVERAININPQKIIRKNPNEFPTKNSNTKHQRFHFDPTSYKKCQFGNERMETFDDDPEYERIDPNTLISVLDVLCTMTHGIVIDPSSGIVCNENLTKA
ncbi:MAG: hypothetical protein LBK06_08165 [Planctomycetaceae bacterium]|jgi:hypothetical protein|nr:hypothetical protein [Planctomycetaceae bacterium]